MIKLQDFANQQGCSERNVQKHLKNYASELEGLFERRGHNGTWLTEEACEFLRGKMKSQPLSVIVDTSKDEEIERLQKQIKDLQERIEKKDVLFTDLQKCLALKDTVLEEKQTQLKLLEEKSRENTEKAVKEAEDKIYNELTAKHLENERKLEEHYKEKMAQREQELRSKSFLEKAKWIFRK